MPKLYATLCEKLGRTRSSLDRFSDNAPKKYKVYTIPKRTSGRRVIAHPSTELKRVQKKLVDILNHHFLVHQAAFAYKKNLSIKDNATKHQKSRYLLKMDFSDFFNSITPAILFAVCEAQSIDWSQAEQRLLTQLLFWNRTKSHGGKLVLSVGAPSSPLISNFVMFDFDQKMTELCKDKKIIYTRYADDLTFSTNQKNSLFDIPALVKTQLKSIYANQITINEMKTVFSSKAHNRHVTGVTLTNDNKLSLGRERKRMLSSLIHQYKIGILNEQDSYYLQGLLAFSMSIEPDFIKRMSVKYSPSLINTILGLRAKQ